MLKIQEFIGCFDNIKEANLYLSRSLRIESYGTTSWLTGADNAQKTILYKPGVKADLSNPLVAEANCLILDEDGEVLAKAWPHMVEASDWVEFPKKFECLSIHRAEEVPDGITVVIYNIDGIWVIGSTDDAYANNRLNRLDIKSPSICQVAEAFLNNRMALGPSGWEDSFRNVNPMACFVCSFVSPEYHGAVMPITRPEMYLMTVYNLESQLEFSGDAVNSLAGKLGLARPVITSVMGNSTISQRLGNMRALAPGLILIDSRAHRVLIPNPIYKATKSALDAGERVQPVHIAKIIQALRDKQDYSTIVRSFPDFEPMMLLLWEGRIKVWHDLMELWKIAEPLVDNMKKFAEAVMHHPLNSILFMLKDKKLLSIQESIEQLKPHKLVRLVEKMDEKEFDRAKGLLKFAGGNNGVSKEESGKEETSVDSRDGDTADGTSGKGSGEGSQSGEEDRQGSHDEEDLNKEDSASGGSSPQGNGSSDSQENSGKESLSTF